jgi:hypothetical protein
LLPVASVVFVVVCSVVPFAYAQSTGITSILDLQYPSTAVLQGGVAQVTVTFKVYFNYYHNPQGYLIFGVFDSRASTYVKGSATSAPDQCQLPASAQYPNSAMCGIVPSTSSGSEYGVFTLTFNAPQDYALSAVALIWDSTNLQSGNQVGSVARSDFTISVTGQAATSSITSLTTTSSTNPATSTTPSTSPTSSAVMTSITTTTPGTQSTLDSTALLALVILLVVLAAVVALVALRRRPARPTPPAMPVQSRQAASEPSQAFCTNCGARLPAGYRFCGKCGAKQQ